MADTDLRGRKAVDGQIAYFRIYPHRASSQLYLTVRVFRSCRALHRFIRASGSRCESTTRGMCRSWKGVVTRRGKYVRTTPEIGDILLVKRWCRTGVLTHEVAHAMFAWARRKKIVDLYSGRVAANHYSKFGTQRLDSTEERCCYAIGNMAKELVDRLYKLKVIG